MLHSSGLNAPNIGRPSSLFSALVQATGDNSSHGLFFYKFNIHDKPEPDKVSGKFYLVLDGKMPHSKIVIPGAWNSHYAVLFVVENKLRREILGVTPVTHSPVDTLAEMVGKGVAQAFNSVGVKIADNTSYEPPNVEVGYPIYSPDHFGNRDVDKNQVLVSVRSVSAHPVDIAQCEISLHLKPSFFADELEKLVSELCRLGSNTSVHPEHLKRLYSYVTEFYAPKVRALQRV